MEQNASKYVQFEGSADTPNKRNSTLERWCFQMSLQSLQTVKAKIEVVYPGNASATRYSCERIRSITSKLTIQQLSLQSIHVPLVKLTLQRCVRLCRNHSKHTKRNGICMEDR
ncbi:hypothetical protein AK86_07790 [Streptococcus pneumoniae B1599]|nr:hypothetical protein AK86_07790 [Streptococcus pneumoniae B1599]